jgi:hypothetical protein
MRMKFSTTTGSHFGALVLALLLSGSLHAQSDVRGRPATRVPVTIVEVERVPKGNAAFMIQRRSDGAPRDVILLRAGANASELSEAIRTLLMVRQATGDTASTTATFRARPPGGQHPRERAPLPWVGRVLSNLHNSEVREVPGHGRAKAVQIWLPAQHRRTTSTLGSKG